MNLDALQIMVRVLENCRRRTCQHVFDTGAAGAWLRAIKSDEIVVYQRDEDFEFVFRNADPENFMACQEKRSREPAGTVQAWCEEQGIAIDANPGDCRFFKIAPKDEAEAMFVKMRWY